MTSSAYLTVSFRKPPSSKKITRRGTSNEILDHTTNTLKSLLKDYNRKLIETGYGLSRSDLKKKNIIDARSLFKEPNPSTESIGPITMEPEDTNFFHPHGIYSVIPCFEDMVLQLNTDRYIHVAAKKIDPMEETLQLHFHDYFKSNDTWNLGVSGNVTISMTKDNKLHVSGDYENDYYDFPKINRMLSMEELHWNKEQYDKWEKLIISFADKTLLKMKNECNTNPLQELSRIYISIIIKVNRRLSEQKPKTKRQSSAPAQRKIITEKSLPADKRRVRIIGDISVSSEKIPRLPCRETVIHYKTASWTARGYMRTMKSGKKVYVKESVRKRHALQKETDTAPAPCTIRFK